MTKYYMLQEDESEPRRWATNHEDEFDTAWVAVCTRMVELLGEWLDEADGETMSAGPIGGALSIGKFNEMSAAYAKFDNDGEGIALPYVLHLPAAGIVPAQTIKIWEEEEVLVQHKPDSMIDLSVTLTTGPHEDKAQELGHQIRSLSRPDALNSLHDGFAMERFMGFFWRDLFGADAAELRTRREQYAEMAPKVQRLDAVREYLLREFDEFRGAEGPNGATLRRVVARALYVLDTGISPLHDVHGFLIYEARLENGQV